MLAIHPCAQIYRCSVQTGGKKRHLAGSISEKTVQLVDWGALRHTLSQIHTHQHTHTCAHPLPQPLLTPQRRVHIQPTQVSMRSVGVYLGINKPQHNRKSMVYKCQKPFYSPPPSLQIHVGTNCHTWRSEIPKSSSSAQNRQKQNKINLFQRGWMRRTGEWQSPPAVSFSTWR